MNFNEYKLCPEIIKSLDLMNYISPTEVQKKVIPLVLQNNNIIVKSQTGSGKTASFGIPIIELLNWEELKPQALVIVPTRELAVQVGEDLFNIGRFKRVKVLTVYGKTSITHQEKELKQKTHIVVGTPGRLIDLIERKSLDLTNIKYLIIDEADEILNMGFIEQLETIINKLPIDRKNILLSATMPDRIKLLASKYIKEYKEVITEETKSIKETIKQEVYNINEEDKINLLNDLLIKENPDSAIIFCNTKQKVDIVYDELSKYNCEKIHGGMEQVDRINVMNEFKKGNYRYLIATDVAARGIDIEDVSLVVNFDIPVDKEIYVHRIGRTGRIGKKGKAITFVTKYELRFLSDIENLIGNKLTVTKKPSVEEIRTLRRDFLDKMNTIDKEKKSKGSVLNKEIIKLHINAGKKTKMRAVDIVGTICSIEGITKDDIGIIDIRDISTFVEIINNKGEIVFKELQNKPIKGRIRKVDKKDI